jgi:hypothetical protein
VELTRQTGKRRIRLVFQVVSFITLVLALLSAIVVVALRLIHCFNPTLFLLSLKSGIPLSLIGLSFAFFQFAVRRTRSQCILGLIVSVAFILWGSEQFLANQTVAQFIDDIVVFLFVLDLSIVILGSFKEKNGDKALRGKNAGPTDVERSVNPS